MDSRRSILNVSIAIISRVALLVVALLVKRMLISYIGNDVNGLESLFANVIGMLSVAELGVGSAIAFSMYSSIVKGDKVRVVALYCFYKKAYRIIGVVILTAGIVITPIIPCFIGDYDTLNVNVYLTFLLTLIAVVISYGYSAKTALIEAYKDNYITTVTLTASRLICFGLQVLVILTLRSYTAFVICHIVESIVNWGLTELVAHKLHGEIIKTRETISQETKTEVDRNTKAMFMHKIGAILCDSTDSIIISGFVGVMMLGKYNNYSSIAVVLTGTIALFFTPLTSIIGHLCVQNERDKIKTVFDRFYSMNFALGLLFFLGYYAVIDNVVALILGTDLEVSHSIVFIITLNQFTKFMRRTLLLFRNASGAFYHDRWKPLVEGVSNLVLSLVFVVTFPEEYSIVGVIVATILTTLLICHTVEPYIVFHNVFGKSPRGFYIRNYAYIALFTVCVLAMECVMRPVDSDIKGIFVNGSLSVLISISALVLLTTIDRRFRDHVKYLRTKIIRGKQTT